MLCVILSVILISMLSVIVLGVVKLIVIMLSIAKLSGHVNYHSAEFYLSSLMPNDTILSRIVLCRHTLCC
jgi:hypothetical protein